MSPRKPKKRPEEDPPRIDELGGALSDARPVDWESERARAPRLARRLRGMERLESLVRAHRSVADSAGLGGEAPVELFEWGPFRALELVGEGGFGQVYRAFDPRLQREVALKLRRAVDGDSGEGHRAFLDEARHLARVRHSNVLVVHGADVHDGRAGFWTDFIHGQTLESLLKEAGPMAAEEVVRIGVSICRALRAVHAAGLIHGDVKASNVMRESSGRLLLMDFGAVSRRTMTAQSPDGALPAYGTPLVLAPEVLRGQPATPASDLYSLGVLLYQLATGDLPVQAESWTGLLDAHAAGAPPADRSARLSLSPELESVVARALEPDAAGRYPSAAEMESALSSAIAGAPDSDEHAQPLRRLLEELGRVPEELCRQIGTKLAAALLAEPAGRRASERLSLDRVALRTDGTLVLTRSGRGDEAADLKDVGEILRELLAGRSSQKIERGESEPPSEFLGQLIQALLDETPRSPLASIASLAAALSEGEQGTWWREHERRFHRAARRARPVTRADRDTEFRGRSEALEILEASFERAKAGKGQMLLIQGEAGIGKSRLVDEFLLRLTQTGAEFQWLRGSYPPGEVAGQVGAFLHAFRDFLGEAELESSLDDYLSGAPLLKPPLHAFLAGQRVGAEADRASRDLLQRAIAYLTEALSESCPTVLWIDDLHFAPTEGRAMFAALAAAIATQRVLLIGSTRPELPAEWLNVLARLPHGQELRLEALTLAQVSALVAEALPSARMAEALAPGLASRSDGNPLFLIEHLRSLAESGLLSSSTPGHAASRLQSLPTPPSIQRLIQTRVLTLAPEDQELLDAGACLGFEFDPDLVARALGQELLPVLRRLARIERSARLVRSSGRQYRFDHHETREALYSGLFAPLREQYHASLGLALEAREGASSKELASLEGPLVTNLAEHFLRGGREQEASRYLSPALDYLEGSYQTDAAVRLAGQALARSGFLTGRERVEAAILRARCLCLLGRPDDEQAAIESLNEIAFADGDLRSRAEARALLGDLYLRVSKLEDARPALEDALRLAEECGDRRTQVFTLANLGTLGLHQGRYADARVAYEGALTLARELGHRRGEATAMCHLGIVNGLLARHDESRAYFEAAAERSREIGYPLMEALSVGNLGVVFESMGEFDRACECFERNIELSRVLGFRRGEASARANLGTSLLALGRLEEAMNLMRGAIENLAEVQYHWGELAARANLGRAHAEVGRWQEARAGIERSAEQARSIGDPKDEALAELYLSAVAREEGKLEEAEQLLRHALEIVQKLKLEDSVASASLWLATLLCETNRREEARPLFDQARRLGAASKDWAAAILGGLLDPEADAACIATATDQFNRESVRLSVMDRLRIQHRRAELGDRHAGQEARRLLEHLREHAPEADRDSMLEKVALYREVLRAGTAR